MADLQFVGMVFETFIILVALIFLVLILMKFYEKKHQLTLYLFLIFLSYIIAIVFSWLSKIFALYSGIDYVEYNTILPDPGTPLSWILLRIVDFRISFVFLSIGIYLSYIFKVKVFGKGYNKVLRIVITLYAIITAGFALFVYQRGYTLYDVFAFLFIFIFMALIYIPFFIESFQSFKDTDNKVFKTAFLSLAIMAIFFILVPLSFLIDRILILAGGPGFSLFYFLAWIFVIFAILGAYFGYIRPKSEK
ncbi:hypothetical protein ES705_08520 [subsurface metagenome]